MTHINAYEQDVLEAEQKLVLAKGELDAAKVRLADKKIEDGVVEKHEDKPEKVEVRVKGELKKK